MHARRICTALLATALVTVLAGQAGGAPKTAVTGFLGCASYTGTPPVKAQVRPASIIFACGDGNFYVDHLRWSSWKATTASGTGTGELNDCSPYCAAGHFHGYPLHVLLFRRTTCAAGKVAGNRPVFVRVGWSFTGAKPAHTSNSAMSFPCPTG